MWYSFQVTSTRFPSPSSSMPSCERWRKKYHIEQKAWKRFERADSPTAFHPMYECMCVSYPRATNHHLHYHCIPIEGEANSAFAATLKILMLLIIFQRMPHYVLGTPAERGIYLVVHKKQHDNQFRREIFFFHRDSFYTLDFCP